MQNMDMVGSNRKINMNMVRGIHNDIADDPHGYVLFDGHPKGYENAQVRNGIFKDEITYVYCVNN